mmetsp:Transcript_51546/g.101173  ORF Transcript_51546/g.101173 Transcript_51546/m.101173 type:complete len:83 (-) Transcript_51546:4-252(-)
MLQIILEALLFSGWDKDGVDRTPSRCFSRQKNTKKGTRAPLFGLSSKILERDGRTKWTVTGESLTDLSKFSKVSEVKWVEQQ